MSIRAQFYHDRRRHVLGAAVTLLAWPALAATLPTPTPMQTRGPYYPPREPADSDLDLTRVQGRAESAKGGPIDVLGRVLDAKGGSLAGARVEIWQADWQGHYHHPADRSGTADPDFQGFGAVVVGADGAYRFRTIRPKFYGQGAGQRTPHIHFRVIRPNGAELVTQMYFPGEAMNDKDAIYRSLGSDALRAALTATAEGGDPPRFRFDIVLA